MKKSSMAICAFCSLATIAWFWPQSADRVPAQHQGNPNVEILEQISLYPNMGEPPKRRE